MLRAARNNAGLSREEAAHSCMSAAGRLPTMSGAPCAAGCGMRMAEVYGSLLTADYCAKMCPIGQVLAHSLDRSEFAMTVLRVLKNADVERLRTTVKIAADGQLHDHEMDELILKEMEPKAIAS